MLKYGNLSMGAPIAVALFATAFSALPAIGQDAAPSQTEALIGAMLGDTPMIDDLKHLTDAIGGRATGSPANLEAVDWALARFEEAGVAAVKDPFMMDYSWSERSVRLQINGDISFETRAVAKEFSPPTPPAGLTAPLVNLGAGGEAEFKAAGDKVNGAWALIETDIVADLSGLFGEYTQAGEVEPRAAKAGAVGVIFMGSRPNGLLYRMQAKNPAPEGLPVVIMEREAAMRVQRLLEDGADLTVTGIVDTEFGAPYQSYNVIAEIPGGDLKDEIIVIGAHLDSHALGTGANDNGVNVALVMDIARQMRRLGVQPRRTIRFILWNGEEQGLVGSRRYVAARENEMANHKMAMSIDVGSGRIIGFFTNGRGDELRPIMRDALIPAAGLGPFHYIDEPIFGTDNFDFLASGVANLVANQETDAYGPHYHSETDIFETVDLYQARINAAIIAAVTMHFANSDYDLPRQSRRQISRLVETTSLADQMRTFNAYADWKDGKRGRK